MRVIISRHISTRRQYQWLQLGWKTAGLEKAAAYMSVMSLEGSMTVERGLRPNQRVKAHQKAGEVTGMAG
jgi:hypothetical protein